MSRHRITHPEGCATILTAPMWRLLEALTRAQEQRQATTPWLPAELLPALTRTEREMVAALARYGVLEQSKGGYHLPARIRAQVVSTVRPQ